MGKKRIEEIVLTLFVMIAFSACANRTVNTVTDSSASATGMQQEAAVASSEGADVISRIQFDKGRTVLSASAQTELNHAIEQARTMGQIGQITIAVWSDMEYPTKEKQVPSTQLDIADRRGEELSNYLQRNFNYSNIRIHNMGKQPNALAKFLDSNDARLKKKLAAAGKSSDQGLFDDKTRASSALILVDVN